MTEVISVRHLSKTFRVPVPNDRPGLSGTIRHFLANPTTAFAAVKDLSWSARRGEIVGFLGANGSGKSTTIKMLTGILTPTSGEAEVLGFVPWRQRLEYTRHIGVVMGQKSLLWWNIPVIESFKLYRDIYGQSEKDFTARLNHFCALLDLGDILHMPVRKLSLGLRMRAEIAASLLHSPEVIFLDEPTIGLDVLARMNLKSFLRRVNEETGTTIILTTHNMVDVEELCRRCLIIDRGELIYDGDVAGLKARENYQILEFEVEAVLDEARFRRALARGLLIEQSDLTYKLQVSNGETPQVVEQLLGACRLSGLHVLPPSLESIVRKIFAGEERRPSDAAPVLAAAG
jgi:ABC-2 type transport system ATP-binding protein